MGRTKRIISTVSAVAIAASSFLGGVRVRAAALKDYSVAELIKGGKAKAIGRYTVKDGKMSAFWAGNGFELNVKCKAAGTLQLFCDTNDKVYLAVFIDGVLQDREAAISQTTKDITVNIPKGTHNVRIVRDIQINKDGSFYFYFEYFKFGGQILKKPADKKLYIEVIGDSIACGDGANGHYVRGESWRDPEDHSFVKSFCYKLATDLNADYSVVARGGIGLFKDTSGSQEKADSTKITMQEIYDYTNGYADMGKDECKYSFERKPDLIIFELSGNDATTMEDVWKQRVIDFLSHVRELNGSKVPIVWSGRNDIHYATVLSVIRENALADGGLYACYYKYGGSGAAALKTQTAGHPDSGEQAQIADNLLKFIKNKEVLKMSEIEEKVVETAEEAEETVKETAEEAVEEVTEVITEKKKVNVKKVAAIGGAAVGVAAIGAGVVAFLLKKKRKNR